MTGTVATRSVLARAERVAEEVLFPAALKTDATGVLPPSHLDRLADEGFYGLFGPREFGGLEVDPAVGCRVVETLASGCLATAFVWLQHHGAVKAVAASENPGVREQWLGPLCRGARRAGTVNAALRPGPAAVRARPVAGGYILDGEVAWVTGWGHVDTLFTAARDEQDTVIWALLDAEESATLTIKRLELVALNASYTANVCLSGHFVPAERMTGTLPFADWPARDAAGLRMNGSLALGVADRCRRLMDPGPLTEEVAACRARLDEADATDLPDARAAASELAVRAATTLIVSSGAPSVLLSEHGQRLLREAAVLLVFGSRRAIRDELLRRMKSR